jgi:hypothetical protein
MKRVLTGAGNPRTFLESGRRQGDGRSLNTRATLKDEPKGTERLRVMAFYDKSELQSPLQTFAKAVSQSRIDREAIADAGSGAIPALPVADVIIRS